MLGAARRRAGTAHGRACPGWGRTDRADRSRDRGNLHQRAGRLDEAAAAYERAVELDPGLGRAHFELGRTYIRLERFADALPHARRAVEFTPDHAGSRQMLADLLEALGR